MSNNESSKKKSLTIFGISIWRLFAYFIIYSVVGFIIETLFALFMYNVLESRQSFLYGPFCGIYGVGAVFMIMFLNKYFNKNTHMLFWGGFIIGSILEYIISLVGELILDVRWWDYSNRFLNINGRICFLYSIFWGLLAIYLMKVINPKVNKLINWLKSKINIKLAKFLTLFMIIFLFIDCIISGIAINFCLIRKSVENNLSVANKEKTIEAYNKIYNNQKLSEFISRYWNDEKMVKTYPNLKLNLENGETIYIKDLTPEVQPYYYKFKERKGENKQNEIINSESK